MPRLNGRIEALERRSPGDPTGHPDLIVIRRTELAEGGAAVAVGAFAWRRVPGSALYCRVRDEP